MLRIRIAGPRGRLDEALAALQDLNVLHVDRPQVAGGRTPDRAVTRERHHVERCLSDVETALERLRTRTAAAATFAPPLTAAALRRARRVRQHADRLARADAALQDERRLLRRYREFFDAFRSLVGHELSWPDGQAFYIVLRAGAASALAELTRSLETALEGETEVLHHQLPSGEIAVLILTSARAAKKVSGLLAASRVDELPAPAGLGEHSLLRALPALEARLAAIPPALESVDAERRALADAETAWLSGLRLFLRDQLLRLDARARVFAAAHMFVIEGWLPAARLTDLEQRLAATLGSEVDVSTVGAEDWAAVDRAPVALQNPPLFRPFEVLTQTLPLPKYGTIDPTPFVAIFFPAFFGLMLGDIGYGLMLAGLAWLLRVKSPPDTTLRAVSTVALACSSSAIAFGMLFGEFFGSLGHAVGLHPFFDRERATIPFLGLAIAIGAVHIVLGLVLAGITAWRHGHRREAMGRGVALAMLVLTALLLLAAFDVLPAAFLTPLVVAIFLTFTLLVALEGIAAVIELLSTFGHILSYARIMALGTASLMLAVVANEMAGAMGSVVVGAVFALLFHLVNFAIGVFSPAIHALRLHYVEFFGHFFSPGGVQYRPLGHWHPAS
jgi:V/A-type H+-transporting ATPase subunit I